MSQLKLEMDDGSAQATDDSIPESPNHQYSLDLGNGDTVTVECKNGPPAPTWTQFRQLVWRLLTTGTYKGRLTELFRDPPKEQPVLGLA